MSVLPLDWGNMTEDSEPTRLSSDEQTVVAVTLASYVVAGVVVAFGLMVFVQLLVWTVSDPDPDAVPSCMLLNLPALLLVGLAGLVVGAFTANQALRKRPGRATKFLEVDHRQRRPPHTIDPRDGDQL